MLVVVVGGSGSGKSEYAEQIAMDLSENDKRIYLATMKVYGESAKKRITRHVKARQGKGFDTVELAADIYKVKEHVDVQGKNDTVLIECLSNLVANEMFWDDMTQRSATEVTDKILCDLKAVSEQFPNVVIVTNNVSEDGIKYDAGTMSYIRAIEMINSSVCRMADQVFEVVAGIPVRLK